ncbi:MAG: 23S rRNA (pseudouridine(1915)-N(3))-methyltransferase RlmH [Verrucomicrobia bacterium]|nr:23S rRNA (pseudouridine(1915)-N(3))-methyltransferase RlmH [Verrucomicrobiota bacterium]
MNKVKIFSIGKTKEAWLKEALDEYSKRLGPILSIEWILVKDNAQLEAVLVKEDPFIALEPTGKMFTSEDFSKWLIQSLEAKGSRLNFVIGGAQGIPPEISKRAFAKISLSKMTFTHQITRLILIEQIYRSFEIDKGSQYHK